MKSDAEIQEVMTGSYKTVEFALGIKIRNGQAMEGIRKALTWVAQ